MCFYFHFEKAAKLKQTRERTFTKDVKTKQQGDTVERGREMRVLRKRTPSRYRSVRSKYVFRVALKLCASHLKPPTRLMRLSEVGRRTTIINGT